MTNAKRKTLHGIYLPDFGRGVHPRTLIDLAVEAEESGWDGLFIWDHMVEWNGHDPVFDAFTCLAAIATQTKRIRIGSIVTPLPLLKPWIVARQTVTLDHLSDGRLILGVGLGGKESCDYERFGESAENEVLAQKLDESLQIINGLWTAQPFTYAGKHYLLKSPVFLPRPKQKPRIPIWVAGFWPRKGPFKRAAKWDGVIPLKFPDDLLEPYELRTAIGYIRTLREDRVGFDVAVIGSTQNSRSDSEKLTKFADAGMSWWLENLYSKRNSSESIKKRIRLGPPD
jgi:alkanesulfonate monooxygenase SsuD/methylene tetrahydromethanopterin reductase-like flavin-dependent oxidoreductase (luciferase family)